jgi:hypothetical protein
MTIVDHFKKMLITLGWFATGTAVVSTTVLLYKALSHLI